jgi:hypothetical protein
MERHRLDLVSAFFGLLFPGLGITILTAGTGLSARHLSVFGPVALIAFGLILLATWGRNGRSSTEEPAARPAMPVMAEGEAPVGAPEEFHSDA